MVSYFHFYKMVKEFNFEGSFDDFFTHLFKRDKLVHGNWFDFNLGWWKHKDDPNFLFVTYEEMKQDIRSVINKICKFLNKNLSSELIDEIIHHTSFDEMQKNKMTNTEYKEGEDGSKASFIRKGQIGEWVNYFNPEQLAYCDALTAEKMAASGIDLPQEML